MPHLLSGNVLAQAPGYFDLVHQPMDLSTVAETLQDHHYSKLEEFAADVLLIFVNCRLYNQPDAQASKLAGRAQVCFFGRMRAAWPRPSKKED